MFSFRDKDAIAIPSSRTAQYLSRTFDKNGQNGVVREVIMNGLEVIRLEVFRQLKEEISGSQDYFIVGIDVAWDKHHAFFGTATCRLFSYLIQTFLTCNRSV